MSSVVVVSTGGTIAMRPDPETGKLVPAVSGEELVDMLAWPEAPPLELDDFVRVPSFDMHCPRVTCRLRAPWLAVEPFLRVDQLQLS